LLPDRIGTAVTAVTAVTIGVEEMAEMTNVVPAVEKIKTKSGANMPVKSLPIRTTILLRIYKAESESSLQ
jgi:hypothetical protein